MEKPYKRLVAELAVAKKLESRASQELSAAKPGDELSPSLKAAVEASVIRYLVQALTDYSVVLPYGTAMLLQLSDASCFPLLSGVIQPSY